MSHERLPTNADVFDKQPPGKNMADIARSLSIISNEGVLLANGNRLKVTSTENLLATRYAYDEQPDLFQVVENTNGSLNYLGNEDAVELAIGTAQGDKMVYSTNEFFHYQSYRETHFGRGYLLPEFQAGQRTRVGAFFEQDGFYSERDENGDSFIVRRSNATGSVVEERVAQADWNINTFLEGDNHIQNPSQIVLDFDMMQMWKGGILWYGAGYIYVGFQIGMRIYLAHVFQGANLRREPILGEPTVPLRAEIENITSVSSPASLKLYGANAAVETGEFEDVGFLHGVSNRSTAISTNASGGAYVRLITIRPKLTFKGKTNRVKLEPQRFTALAPSANHSIIVAQDVPITNTPTWQDVGDDSAAEYSLDAQGANLNNGLVRLEEYAAAGGGAGGVVSGNADSRNPLVLFADGTQGNKNVAVFARATGNSGGSCFGGIQWLEIF